MKKIALAIIILCMPLFVFGQEMVERIIIVGNERIEDKTIIYYLSSREGDYYNPDLLKRDFKVLWATGFFSNIIIEEEQGTGGKIVKITLEENPVIKEIVYKTGKKLKEDDIVEKLKEKNVYILPYSYYSPYKIQRIEGTIKELLFEKGLTTGTVTVEENKKGSNELEVVFDIDEGPKIKVGEIYFKGKPMLRKGILMSGIKENKKHNLYSWIAGKDNFKESLLPDDLVSLKKKYQEHGYMEAVIGEPIIEDIEKNTIFLKKRKMKKIIIPVNPGSRYMAGKIEIVGNKILTTEGLLTLIKLKEGKPYTTKVREDAVEKIREVYMDGGYIFSQPMPVENLDPKRKIVNLTFNIYEGEVAYLRKIEFTGNTYTKDKVIRREMLIREGDRFRFSAFKNSLLRMKQLGLVEIEGEPDVVSDPQEPTQLDVNLRLTELQRNNIQFSAGYSGYEGTFIALGYSTVNFLGAGEKLDLTFQHGKRVKNYSFGFSEPYLFDLPITLGFNIFSRDINYPGLYDRKGQGIDFTLGARIKGFLRGNLSYGFEDVDITLPGTEEGEEDPLGNDPVWSMMYGLGNYKISSITPTLYRNTIDSPLTPSRGTMFMVSAKFAGGFLGGEIHMIKPRFELSYYQPIYKNTRLGFHAEYSFVTPTRDEEVPFWEKFYLGGERSIRGYTIYSIGPRSEQGSNIGGAKSLVVNAEYIIPIGGPVFSILFFDVGNAYALEEKIDIKNMFFSTGVELRIFIPALRVPFRLIFAYNNRLIYDGDSNFNFRFAIGTTF